MAIDDYSPVYCGDLGSPFAIQFLHKDGTPVNLAYATISMKMENQDSPLTVKTCSGTWTIDDAINGKAHYQWQTADVSTVGMWMLYVKITIGGLPVTADPKILEILPVP
jgi:hypothetical protein